MSSLAQQLVDAAVYASVDDAIASATPGGILQRAVDGPGDSGAGSRVTEQALEWCRKEAESARGECEEERRARIIAEADLLDAKRFLLPEPCSLNPRVLTLDQIRKILYCESCDLRGR
jgi:hypothetical protein